MNSLFFSTYILNWYYLNKRDLPWRSTSNPYKIWISEIILQQTRIEQGIPYYHNLIDRFPTIRNLASASEDEILKLWQGLGYYSRARNLHAGAKQIVNKWQGRFPDHSADLLTIKGIGEYTAAAIASIAFNEPIAAIDGNVYRVLSRYFGIETPIDTSLGKKHFKQLANQLIDITSPGNYNQAIMEFGALHCTPKKPKCETCPFIESCQANLCNTINQFPVKSKTKKVRNRYIYYLVVEHKSSLYFNKRIENDIWKNLFDFPSIELPAKVTIPELLATSQWQTTFKTTDPSINRISETFIHLLSHQRIHACFINLSIKNEKNLPSNFLKIDKKNTFELAVPRVIENYLTESGFI